jgi:2-haloacid dehalogenase
VRNHLRRLGRRAAGLSQLWRKKQLEYSWLRSLMQAHADFWKVTRDALDYACDVYEVSNEPLKQALMDSYLHLEPYPGVKDTLRTLRQRGMRCTILSNGSPQMLAAAVESAGLTGEIETVISAEEVQVFKPVPAVYQLIEERLRVKREEIFFVSSNAWDVIGAGRFGLRVVWVNPELQPRERLPFDPQHEIRRIGDLPGFFDVHGTFMPRRP